MKQVNAVKLYHLQMVTEDGKLIIQYVLLCDHIGPHFPLLPVVHHLNILTSRVKNNTNTDYFGH